MRLFSKIDKKCQLATVIRRSEIIDHRHDLSPETECLQAAAKSVSKGTRFPSHKHNKCERHTTKTQEAWVVLEGKIKAYFYDIDDKLHSEIDLSAGDCAIVFSGGHGFDVLMDNTIIYEFKNGPYFGRDADKSFIV
tara:strand:- start:172 stop:579 length:408 start_codon:yes stop_codon:yes gene_type:complete